MAWGGLRALCSALYQGVGVLLGTNPWGYSSSFNSQIAAELVEIAQDLLFLWHFLPISSGRRVIHSLIHRCFGQVFWWGKLMPVRELMYCLQLLNSENILETLGFRTKYSNQRQCWSNFNWNTVSWSGCHFWWMGPKIKSSEENTKSLWQYTNQDLCQKMARTDFTQAREGLSRNMRQTLDLQEIHHLFVAKDVLHLGISKRSQA